MIPSAGVNELQEIINNQTHEQANPSHLISLFEKHFSPLDEAPKPVRKFYSTYLNKENPSVSLNKNGMLLYLPQLQEDLDTPMYSN